MGRPQTWDDPRQGGGTGVVRVQPRGVGLNPSGIKPDTDTVSLPVRRPLPIRRETKRQSGNGAYAAAVNTAADERVAAFFDLDKTIIAKSSTLAFSRPFFRGGLINRRAVLKSAYAQFMFMLSGADADQMDRMR